MTEKQQLAESYDSKLWNPLWFQVDNAKFLKSRRKRQLVADQFTGYPDVLIDTRNELGKQT